MAREIVYSEDGIINARVKQKVDTLPNWESNPIIILDGEQAFVTTPDGTPINFKIGDGTKDFSELPFWLDSGSPFKLRLTDTDFVQVTGGNTIITHPGLIGFDDYPVTSTQINTACFRDSDLTYDSVAGRVTIHDFELQISELIILSPPSMKWAEATGSGSAFAALVERVDELERKTAPFVVNEITGESSARVWWTRPINEIPTGWAIDTDWNGRVPVGYSSADTEFNVIGKTGGAKNHGITINQLPKHRFFIAHAAVGNVNNPLSAPDGATQQATTDAGSSGNVQYRMAKTTGEANRGRTNELGNDEAIPLLPPYRVGCWIKYVGV